MKRMSCAAEEDLCPPESKKSKEEQERKGLEMSLFSHYMFSIVHYCLTKHFMLCLSDA